MLVKILVVLVIVGCNSQRQHKREEQIYAAVISDDPDRRGSVMWEIVGTCCSFAKDFALACRGFAHAIEHEDHESNLEKLFLSGWGVRCRESTHATAVVGAFKRARTTPVQKAILRTLADFPPSIEVVNELLTAMPRVSPETRYTILHVLSGSGDAELRKIAEVLMRGSLDGRRNAADAIDWALMVAPVDDVVHAALLAAAQDADPDVAKSVRRAIGRSNKHRARSVDDIARDVLKDGSWQVFGVRRVFCNSNVVASSLQEIAHGPNEMPAFLAIQTIELRQRRCAAR